MHACVYLNTDATNKHVACLSYTSETCIEGRDSGQKRSEKHCYLTHTWVSSYHVNDVHIHACMYMQCLAARREASEKKHDQGTKGGARVPVANATKRLFEG